MKSEQIEENHDCQTQTGIKVAMGPNLFLFELDPHQGVDEVGPHSERVEFDSAAQVGAAVPRAAAWKRYPVHLAFDSGQTAGTGLWITVYATFTAAVFARCSDVTALFFLVGLDFADPRSPEQSSALANGNRL